MRILLFLKKKFADLPDKLIYLAVLFCVYSGAVKAQKNASLGSKVKIDDGWRFHLGDTTKAEHIGFDDHSWRKLDLPHDWSIEGKTELRNPMGNDGGYFPAGIGWYRKEISLPLSQKEKRISIYFEGVYMNAEVFVNGKLLGKRPYGFSSFSYDITPYVKFGAINTIAVKVDNSFQKNCRWYTGSGIYRHVWLLSSGQVHIENWGTIIRTTQTGNSQSKVDIETSVVNKTERKKSIDLKIEILDKHKTVQAVNRVSVIVPANGTKKVSLNAILKNARLWTPSTPNRYTASISIVESNKILDKLRIPFGIRTIEYSAQTGFLLNGKEIKINGGCVHHDNGALGAAAYDRAETRKVEILKSSGFNAVRTSHNPPSETFLYACDSLGLMVMDEAFDGWREAKNKYDYSIYFDEWWQNDIAAMVLRDRNHPSIIFWSTGNEIIERKKPGAVKTGQSLVRLVKTLDPTRPVTSAMTTWDKSWKEFDPLFSVHDISSYNYQLHRASSDHLRVPDRVILQTESYPRDAFANWKIVTENKFVIGDFVWTAMDYLGESGIGRYFYNGETEGQHYDRDIYPWHGAYCGDIDLMGNRKPISFYRDMLYNSKNKLFLAVKEPDKYYGEIKETLWSVWPTWESWTWPEHEGKNIEVEVYSKYPSVKLYLNGQLVGEKPTGRDQQFKATFILPYQQGELKAVGISSGKELEQRFLKTAGKVKRINAKADRKLISANGQDLAYIQIALTDSNGTVQPCDDRYLNFDIQGPATILAVDNADLRDADAYQSKYRKTWKGKALVILKSDKNKGKIRLKISSEGLEDSFIDVQSN